MEVSYNTSNLVLEDQIVEKPSAEAQNLPIEEFNEETGNYEPIWVNTLVCETDFSAFLRCLNSRCKESVLISGVVNTEIAYYEDSDRGTSEYEGDFYYPKYVDPPIHIIDVHDRYPEKVKNALTESFSFYWLDNSACANRTRTTVELILDDLDIERKQLTKKGEYKDLNLHCRLEILSKRDTISYNYLMAIKWIGNSGSHLDGLVSRDILNAYELLNAGLNKLFIKDEERLNELSRKIKGELLRF